MLDSLATAGLLPLLASDILVITQQIVSQAEGRFVHLDAVTPGAAAVQIVGVTQKDPRLVELVLQEASDEG